MAVEKYIIEETASLIHDIDHQDEWKKLLAELKLEGQQNLLNTDNKKSSPCPFVYMNNVMVRVYETICPCKMPVNKYTKTPIPLEVLGLIKLSKDEGYFEKIEVWYDDKSPAPIIVGYRYDDESAKQNGYTWMMSKYIIARWGDELLPWEALVLKAKEIFCRIRLAKLKLAFNTVKNNIDDIDSTADLYFSGSDIETKVEFKHDDSIF